MFFQSGKTVCETITRGTKLKRFVEPRASRYLRTVSERVPFGEIRAGIAERGLNEPEAFFEF